MQITLKEWLAQNGYSNADEALSAYSELGSTLEHLSGSTPAKVRHGDYVAT